MVTWFYFVVFVLSLILTCSILVRNKNVNTMFMLLCILVTINCMGRYMMAISESLEMAIWATKFLYVGGTYAPLLTVIVLSRLCDIKMPRVLVGIMALFSTTIMGLVLTIGKSGLYYEEVELAYKDGYYYLIKTYGPFHNLYLIMMMTYAVIMIFYLVYAARRRKQISFRAVATIGVTEFAIIFMYILERALGSNISYLVVGYLIGIILLIKYFDHINMYDMSTNIVNSVEKMREYGYMVFDEKYQYVSANDFLKELFPEIKDFMVDSFVPASDTYLYKEVILYLKHWDEKKEKEKILFVNDCYYQLNIREISYGRKGKVGYLLEFIDHTMERKYYNTIEEYNAMLENEVQEKTAHIVHIKDMMVLGMADMVESRDSSTGGHIKRTSAVIKIFSDKLKECGEQFDMEEHFLRQIEKAAPMHDLGKIAIDDAVLRKPGKYTEEEYAEMKRHTVEGAKIVENILRGVEDNDFVEITKNIAYYHHEKWNGKGYPMGLSHTDIPVEARIMALADVFDALVSKRCYKEAFSYDKAFSIIEESLGEHFDPKLGKVFLSCREELEVLYDGFASA